MQSWILFCAVYMYDTCMIICVNCECIWVVSRAVADCYNVLNFWIALNDVSESITSEIAKGAFECEKKKKHSGYKFVFGCELKYAFISFFYTAYSLIS